MLYDCYYKAFKFVARTLFYCDLLGMGVTALEAFSFGVPIVTFPTAQSVPALVHGKLVATSLCIEYRVFIEDFCYRVSWQDGPRLTRLSNCKQF